MKNQTLTVLDTHPAMLLTLLPNMNLMEEWSEGEQAMRDTLDSSPEPLFFISDIRQLRLSFDDLIAAVNKGSRGTDPIWHHPRMRGVYFITDSAIVRMAVAGLNNPVFGNTQASTVKSLEEALADIERVLAVA